MGQLQQRPSVNDYRGSRRPRRGAAEIPVPVDAVEVPVRVDRTGTFNGYAERTS